MRIPAIFRPWRVRVGTVLSVTLIAVGIGTGAGRATHGGLPPTILARRTGRIGSGRPDRCLPLSRN